MKVSVIVPVYNTGKYLPKCLDSLVKQTLDDIEIIVVNDGSPDDSQRIIDGYQSRYPQIKGFVKENGGVGDAGISELPEPRETLSFSWTAMTLWRRMRWKSCIMSH